MVLSTTLPSSQVQPSRISSSPSTQFPTDSSNTATSPTLTQSETIMVFTTTLPSYLPSILSSLDITGRTTTPFTSEIVTTSPSSTTAAIRLAGPSLMEPDELSSSIIHILTSAGLHPLVASTAEPVVLPTSLVPSTDMTSTATSTETEEQEIQGAIDAFIQWLMNFFHLV